MTTQRQVDFLRQHLEDQTADQSRLEPVRNWYGTEKEVRAARRTTDKKAYCRMPHYRQMAILSHHRQEGISALFSAALQASEPNVADR